MRELLTPWAHGNFIFLEEVLKKTVMQAIGGNLALWSLALTVNCGCLCRDKASVGSAPARAPGQASPAKPGESWRFVVSGDSRNCGDVVMPGIAAGAKLDGASFYWHLGDLRAIYDFDQDMVQAKKMAGTHLTIIDYGRAPGMISPRTRSVLLKTSPCRSIWA